MTAQPYIVDSHCHLNYNGLKENLDAVLAAAEARNVRTFLAICTKMAEFDQVYAIAGARENVFATAGIHPHEAANEQADLDQLLDKAKLPKVAGIGESGLDYYYENAPKAAQKKAFRVHAEAARQAGLPLVVHSREAEADTYRILKEAAGKGGLTGVFHCFTSSLELARKGLELGFYVSFSGIVTFKNANDVREAAKFVPEDRLLVETDSPYLAPEPHRGKPCQPAYVADTLAFLAELRGVSADRLAAATTANFHRLFTKAKAP